MLTDAPTEDAQEPSMQATRLLTSHQDPAEGRLETVALPDALPAGRVRLAVRRVSLTTNNVTYALFGDRMSYWQFFPSGHPGWGIVPVWGFADVVASAVPEVTVGQRYWGYWPLADTVELQPIKVSASGFIDGAAHRAELPSTYNRYVRCPPDHRVEDEAALAIMRPLFGTAFLLVDFLLDNDGFGARQLVLSSASSKTAYATAWCARDMAEGIQRAPMRRVGLTSSPHVPFVQRLALYDEVRDYGAIEALDASAPTVFCDFSGSAEQRTRVHTHFGDALRHSAVIGATQFSAPPRDQALPGARPTFFFAPDRRRQRLEQWGPALLMQRIEDSQRRFLQQLQAGAQPGLRIVAHQGLDAGRTVLAELARGHVDPALGHVIELG
jgi:hypothetical protein